MVGLTTRTFASRIGRRWFLVLLALACGPLLLSALFAYQRIATELEARAVVDLRSDAKYVALTTLENLRRASDELLRVTPTIGAAAEPVFVRSPRWYSNIDDGDANAELVARVARDQAPRVELTFGSGEAEPVVRIGAWNAASGEVVVGDLRSQWLALPADMLRPNIRLCISASERTFHCVEDMNVGLSTAPEALLTSSWDLFLDGEFGGGVWRFTAEADRLATLSAATVLRRAIWLGFALIAVTALFIGVRLVRSMVGPIEALEASARRLAEGDLKARADIRSADELEDLGAAFNQMAHNLERRFRDSRALARFDRRLLEARSLDEIGAATVTALQEAAPGGLHALVVQIARKPMSSVTFSSDGAGGYHVNERRGPMLARLADAEVSAHRGVAYRAVVATHWPAADARADTLYSMPVRIDDDIAGAVLSIPSDETGRDETIETVSVIARRVAMAMRTLRRDELLERQAFIDMLTGLPNRRRFQTTLTSVFDEPATTRQGGALLFVDLDHFKQINDLAGHRVGDRVLKAVGERLRALIGPKDMLARFGGDEFCMLLFGADAEAAADVARACVAELTQPVRIDGGTHYVGGSVGVARFPQDADSADGLIAAADAAMYAMKESGRGGYRSFDPSMLAQSQRRADVERQLHESLRSGTDFHVVYQPKIDCQTGRAVGLEALLRWTSPKLGAVSPAEFIPIAEECGLIGRIGLHVQKLTAADLAEWRAAHGDVEIPVVSINASQRQLSDGEFAATAAAIFEAVEIPASVIEFEVTETALADNETMMLATLEGVRARGFTISIDDFGSGISSLAKLVEIPFDTLKVDRSFVASWQPGNNSEMVIRTVVGMAHEMGKIVVAEGVETPEQFEFLASIGCDLSQGYLHAKPMPLTEAIAYLSKTNALPALAVGDLAG